MRVNRHIRGAIKTLLEDKGYIVVNNEMINTVGDFHFQNIAAITIKRDNERELKVPLFILIRKKNGYNIRKASIKNIIEYYEKELELSKIKKAKGELFYQQGRLLYYSTKNN